MGRIDEALKRSGTASTLESDAPAALRERDVFVSPWVFCGPIAPPVKGAATEKPTSTSFDRSPDAAKKAVDFSSAWLERLVVAPNPDPLVIEQFRQLAATLHQASSNVRVVMVTSADPSEGKSLITMNLSLTLSDSYARRVLLIDGDLRRPSLHEIVQVPNAVGLGNTLKSDGDQKLPVYEMSERLMLVPAGPPDPDPMSALTSSRMKAIVQEARTQFDWVFIDAPPIGRLADSSLLMDLVDAAILVVRSGRTHYTRVQKAIDAFGRERILGVVLNGAEIASDDAYRGHYATYDLREV